MKQRLLSCVAFACALVVLTQTAAAQRRGRASVCGDPTASCRTGDAVFQEYDLPFRLPKNAVIWETELFYAVVLKSVRTESGWDCDHFVPESERLAAQELFPRNKVFASRCAEAGSLYYTDTDQQANFMAVYAGRTRAEADAFLAKVKATGKYPGANLRRMRAGFNGT